MNGLAPEFRQAHGSVEAPPDPVNVLKCNEFHVEGGDGASDGIRTHDIQDHNLAL